VSQATVRGTQVSEDEQGPKIASYRQSVVVIDGPDRGLRRELRSSRVSIGTAPDNKLVLTDPKVSRHHCEIAASPSGYAIRDLRSTNGTRVNGVGVTQAELPPHARIRVGDSEIRFEPKHKWERVKPLGRRFGELDGDSPAMQLLFGTLSKVAETELTCVFTGETGTGKELAARSLHRASSRGGGPFVVVDCASLGDSFASAELFGYERGAFTDAIAARAGAFESAHGGTMLFDEIGELPESIQPRLLRALEQRTVQRMGGSPIEIDVRVIASSKQPLPALVRDGRFREDLYHRLAEIEIEIPPLRDRLDDVPLLVRAIVDREGGAVTSVAAPAVEWLAAQRWPGNVRQLRNLVRRAIAFASESVIGVEDLLAAVRLDPPPEHDSLGDLVGEGLSLGDARDRWNEKLEHAFLLRLVGRSDGDVDRAASLAGMHKKSLQRLLRRHGIELGEHLEP
jgi:two-component system nitrogen regulation response regulator GlnG